MTSGSLDGTAMGTGCMTGGKCAECTGRRLGLCAELPKRVLARLAEVAHAVDYPANHRFWDEDERPGFAAILQSGYLRMPRYSIEGRRQIVAMVSPGEIVGEGIDTRPGYGMESVTPVRVCRFERGDFLRLTESEPELRRAIFRQYMKRLDVLRWLTWSLGLQTPEERLCAFLARSCETMPYQPLPDGSGILTLEVPRADVADLLGTTKETISRLTHRLQQTGLIEIRDPRHFRIFDLGKLARAGGIAPAGSPTEIGIGLQAAAPRLDLLPERPESALVLAAAGARRATSEATAG